MQAYKPGQQVELELSHVTDDGKGLAWTQEDRLILVEGVEEQDQAVIAKIERILDQTIIAKKIGGPKSPKQMKIRGGVDSPYQMDEDDSDEA